MPKYDQISSCPSTPSAMLLLLSFLISMYEIQITGHSRNVTSIAYSSSPLPEIAPEYFGRDIQRDILKSVVKGLLVIRLLVVL